MKTKIIVFMSCSLLLLLWIGTAVAAPGNSEQALKVGKKGMITLTQQTRAGGTLLQPGTYVIQHRESGAEHFVRFLKVDEHKYATGPDTPPATYTSEDKAGEIPCRVEPAAGPIKQTTVYTETKGGVAQITKVAIKGENVIHIF